MSEAYYEILKNSNDVDELYDAITDIGKAGLSKYAGNVVPSTNPICNYYTVHIG